jgi:hypothetical protein
MYFTDVIDRVESAGRVKELSSIKPPSPGAVIPPPHIKEESLL